MTRDLVASGSARSGLSVDRFADLLVLTEQVASDLLAGSEPVMVSLAAEDGRVDITFESASRAPGEVSRMAVTSLADRHWEQETSGGHLTGFSFVV